MPRFTRAELQHTLLENFMPQEDSGISYDIVEDDDGHQFLAIPVDGLDEDQIADMIHKMDAFAAENGGYFNGTGGRLDRSNDATDEKFYFDNKKFTSRKGGDKKSRK